MKHISKLFVALTAGLLTAVTATAGSHNSSWRTHDHNSYRHTRHDSAEYNRDHKHCKRAPQTITKRVWIPETVEYKTEKVWVPNWVEEVTITKRGRRHSNGREKYCRTRHNKRVRREVRMVDNGYYELKQIPVTVPGYWKQTKVQSRGHGRCVSHVERRRPRTYHHKENRVTYRRSTGSSVFSLIFDL